MTFANGHRITWLFHLSTSVKIDKAYSMFQITTIVPLLRSTFQSTTDDKAEPIARWGRKAMGLNR